MVIVPLLTLGLAVLAVTVAWRSSRGPGDGPDKPPVSASSENTATGAFLECVNCHDDFDKVFQAGLSDLLYRHKTHFADGVSECSACHPANTHEADTINKPTMTRCFICHGQQKTAIAPGTCSTCHPPGSPRQPDSHLDPNWVSKEHSKQALDDRFQCLTCHSEQTCSACHGLQLPHPSDWKNTLHAKTYFADATVCEKCHQVAGTAPAGTQLPPRSLCDTCHHPEGPKDKTWIGYHFNVVYQSGAVACFQCHSTDTCATCHRTGQLDLTADQQLFESNQPTPKPSGSGG